jgi:hypothetical protein
VSEREERWKRYQESTSPPLTKNVLVIFVDAVSRYEMRLKLPQLYQWLK